MHGRGLATRLLEQLAEIAAARGITRFDAELAPDAPALRTPSCAWPRWPRRCPR